MKLVLPIPYQEDCHWLKIQHWFSAPLPEILAVGRTPKTKGKQKENKYTHVITSYMTSILSQCCIEPQGGVGVLSLLRRPGDKYCCASTTHSSCSELHSKPHLRGHKWTSGAACCIPLSSCTPTHLRIQPKLKEISALHSNFPSGSAFAALATVLGKKLYLHFHRG